MPISWLCKQFKPYRPEDNDIMLYKMLWKGVVELICIWVLEGNQNAQWKSSVLLLNTIVTRSGASRNHLMKGLRYCELNWKRMILKPCAVINPIHKASEIHGMWQTNTRFCLIKYKWSISYNYDTTSRGKHSFSF